ADRALHEDPRLEHVGAELLAASADESVALRRDREGVVHTLDLPGSAACRAPVRGLDHLSQFLKFGHTRSNVPASFTLPLPVTSLPSRSTLPAMWCESNAVTSTVPLTFDNVAFPKIAMMFASPLPFLNSYFFAPNGMPSFLPPPGTIENRMSLPMQFTAKPS